MLITPPPTTSKRDIRGRDDHRRPDRDDFFNRQHSVSIDANTAAKRGRIGADPTTRTRPELLNSPTLANPHRRTTGGRIPSLLRLCSSELE